VSWIASGGGLHGEDPGSLRQPGRVEAQRSQTKALMSGEEKRGRGIVVERSVDGVISSCGMLKGAEGHREEA